jgi:hypothetical protein
VAASHQLIDKVYNNLAALPWSGKTKGFSNEEPIYKLTTYATHHWLSNVHENQMLDLFRMEIRLDSSKCRIIVMDTNFPRMLRATGHGGL